MKGPFLFLLIVLFVCNLAIGENSKNRKSIPESLKKINTQADPCNQQLVHRESSLWLTITNWGTIGSQSAFLFETGTDLPAPSANFPGGTDLSYLYQGALWVGGVVEGETLVSVGAGASTIVNNMIPAAACPEGGIIKLERYGDQEYIAVYTDTVDYGLAPEPYEDRPPRPLNLEITQHSYSWISSPYDDFVILDYKVKNIGDKYISDAYIGFYMDTDIFHLASYQGWLDDITGFVEKSVQLPEITKRIDFAWAADNNGDLTDNAITSRSPLSVFGFTLLGSSNSDLKISYNWWVTDINDPQNLDFGPWKESNWNLWRSNYDIWCDGGKGTPCGDRTKYFLMSNGEHDYAQVFSCIDQTDDGWLSPSNICDDLANGLDTRFLYSFGPFDIPAKDSISFTVAIVMGDSLHKGDNPLNSLIPQSYYSKLNFDGLIFNLLAAEMVYESGYTLPPPGPPKDFEILHSTDTSILLSWSSKIHTNFKGYNIYRSSASGKYLDDPVNLEVIQDTFFLDEGLAEGDTLYYTVSSVNAGGKTGKKSEELMIIAGRPNSPTGLSAYADKDKICLSWNQNLEEDVVGYRIYRKEESGEYKLIKLIGLSGLDTTYCDRNFENGVVYYYAVFAMDSKGLEGYLSDSTYALSMSFDSGILLVDMSSSDGRVHVQDDSINAFYNRALANHPFVYTKHDSPEIQYISLKELNPYSVCIIYSEGRFGPSQFPEGDFDSTLVNMRRYLEAGGKLLLVSRNLMQSGYNVWFREGDFFYDILHIDSIYYPSWSCRQEEFIGTQSAMISEFSDLEVDSARVNLSYPKDMCDLEGKLPLIGYFVTRYPEEVIYTFNTFYDTSEYEGKAIGMRHMGEDYDVCFLNFPLYYIKEEQSVPLLHKLLSDFGISPTEVSEDLTVLPKNYYLGQNYPNPFNPTTSIPFTVHSLQSMTRGPVHTTLTVYNILGQKVRVLVDKEMTPGRYEVIWDGRDEKEREVTSGVYFYHLRSGKNKDTRKMILLR